MAGLSLAFFVVLLALVSAQPPQPPQVNKVSEERFQRRLTQKLPTNMFITGANKQRGMRAVMNAKRFVEQKGCNTRVCFALDAGVFVSQAQYTLQQDFVALVAAAAGIDDRLAVTGVQYGLRRQVLTGLTSNIDLFLEKIDASTTSGRWPRWRRRQGRRYWRRRSRMVFKRTLRFCKRQLERGNSQSAKKIVFLGHLKSPRGGVGVARRFLPPIGDGAICAVGFGNGRRLRLERFTGNPDRVLGPEQSGEVLDILEETVRNVCGRNEPQKANSVFKDTAVV